MLRGVTSGDCGAIFLCLIAFIIQVDDIAGNRQQFPSRRHQQHDAQQQHQQQQQQHNLHSGQQPYRSSSSESQINLRPTFKPTARNVTVSPGERAVLRCRVENLGTKTVTWKKFEDVHPLTIGLFPFAPDSRISVDFSQRTNEWSLMIQDVRPMDEGVYQCQISTKDDQDSYDITLNVKNIHLSGTDWVEAGGKIQLICNATGKLEPPHDVQWLKDGMRIDSNTDRQVFITKKIETKVLTSMLVIMNSRVADSGEYTCTSSSRDSGFFVVHVASSSPVPHEKRVAESHSDRMTGSGDYTNRRDVNWSIYSAASSSLRSSLLHHRSIVLSAIWRLFAAAAVSTFQPLPSSSALLCAVVTALSFICR